MASVGYDVQGVSGFGSAQPFSSHGPVVSEAVVQFVLDHHDGKKLGKLQLLGMGTLRAELLDAGLVEPSCRPHRYRTGRPGVREFRVHHPVPHADTGTVESCVPTMRAQASR